MAVGPAYSDLPWKPTSWPGISLVFLDSEADGTARVLIRMEPGCGYPAHRHVGEEEVFVIAGTYRDGRGVYAAGTLQKHPAGSQHAPVAGPEGALLYACAHRGIEVLAP